MKEIEKELRRLKTEISDAKEERASLSGQLKELMKRLLDEFSCGTVAEARKLLTKRKKEKDKLEKDIEHGFGKLQKEYEW